MRKSRLVLETKNQFSDWIVLVDEEATVDTIKQACIRAFEETSKGKKLNQGVYVNLTIDGTKINHYTDMSFVNPDGDALLLIAKCRAKFDIESAML